MFFELASNSPVKTLQKHSEKSQLNKDLGKHLGILISGGGKVTIYSTSPKGSVIKLAWFAANTTTLLLPAISKQYSFENLSTEAYEIRLNAISCKNWNKNFDLEHSFSGKCIQPLKNDIYEKGDKA